MTPPFWISYCLGFYCLVSDSTSSSLLSESLHCLYCLALQYCPCSDSISSTCILYGSLSRVFCQSMCFPFFPSIQSLRSHHLGGDMIKEVPMHTGSTGQKCRVYPWRGMSSLLLISPQSTLCLDLCMTRHQPLQCKVYHPCRHNC